MKDLFSLRSFLCQLLVLGVSFCYGAPAWAVDWTITDLGTLGGTSSSAYGINTRGQVVGMSRLSGDAATHAFLYDGTRPMCDLKTLRGVDSDAGGINTSGQVVGGSFLSGDAAYHAFLLPTHSCTTSYDGTTMRDLGTLGGGYSYAADINTSGQVVGDSDISGDAATHAFLYDGTRTPPMGDLGTLGGTSSSAYGINTSGQVVGGSFLSGDATHHAFLYDGTRTPPMRDLGTLDGTYSSATGINTSGQVVGWSNLSGDAAYHAFLYDGTKMPPMRDLGTLGGTYSSATGINTSGQVVGWSYLSGDAAYHAFLYDGTTMRDLDTLPEVVAAGWQSLGEDWVGINDSGQIVGTGLIGNQYRAFRLHPQATSRYMKTIDTSTLYNLGCSQTNQNGIVILVFGAPRYNGIEYGTTLFLGHGFAASISGIETSVKAFLDGYYLCNGSPGNGKVTVAVGTSTNGLEVTAAHGLAWGEMIVRLNAYISGAFYRDRLSVVGANDIELEWNKPAIARAWVDGYKSASPDIGFYNFGDAAQCPPRLACLNDWTQADIFYVSWGDSPNPDDHTGDGRSFPVPEIYFNAPPSTDPVNAMQWVNIATLYSSSSPMLIPGALTTWQACIDQPPCPTTNTPVQAWQQMMDLLYGVAADPTTVQNILYSSDITWQN